MSNTFGTIFRLTSFGESHGPALGGVIDGVPAGVPIDWDAVQRFVARRRPGQSSLVTSRSEADRVELLSGVLDGVTLGTPIGFIIRNHDHRPGDYDEMTRCFRPSHADYTYHAKYGLRDARGGGRSSARETVSRVVAGAIALQMLEKLGVTVTAYVSQVGEVILDKDYACLDLSSVDKNNVRCPDDDVAQQMEKTVEEARSHGDTLGGTVTCVVQGVPAGWGEPVFDKLHARLGDAMLGINAAKAFEMGLGAGFAALRGSDAIDCFEMKDRRVRTVTNRSGGVQGGISNGEDIYFRVVFKPVPTLMRDVATIDVDGNPCVLHPRGRHDACVVPRAVPIVEAMAALVLVDSYLLSKTNRLWGA